MKASKVRSPTPPRRLPSRRWAVWGALVFLSVGAGYPLLLLFAQSLFPGILAGDFSRFGEAYRDVFRVQGMGEMIRNSLAWAGATTVLSWLLGIPFGVFLARVDFRGKRLARLSLLIPIMTPPYIAALSYILVMQPGGFAQRIWPDLPVVWQQGFFSFWGVNVVMALSSYGYVALALEAALRRIPSRMEDAASQLGAGYLRIFFLILFPLLLPAILNSGLLVFLEALSNFGVPAVLGSRANLPLLPAEIFYLITSWPIDFPLAAALSSLLCLLALIALFTSRRLGKLGEGSFRSSPAPGKPLPRWGLCLAWFFIGLLFLVSTVVPYVAMITTSLLDRWEEGRAVLTFQHYANLLRPGSAGTRALLTSFLLSTTAATVCTILGGFIAYTIVRTSGPLQPVLESMATLPRVLPKIVLAVGLILAWNAPWLPVSVYNTVGMLFLAYVVIYITDALNMGNAAMRNLSVHLETAGNLLGASRARVFWTLVLPQLRPALIAAWITTFIVCMRELVASLLLLPPGLDTTATFIFNQFEQGDIATAMAMATLTILFTTAILLAASLKRAKRLQ